MYGKGVEDLRTSPRGEENERRKVAMYLMKRLCDMTLGEVARDLGVKSHGTVSWACHGISLKCEVNSKYRWQIGNLKTTICQPKI